MGWDRIVLMSLASLGDHILKNKIRKIKEKKKKKPVVTKLANHTHCRVCSKSYTSNENYCTQCGTKRF